jgi:8-amino-7-oxononanoate synthase
VKKWHGASFINRRKKALASFGAPFPFYQTFGDSDKSEILDDNKFINYCSYDYLGLAKHEKVLESIEKGVREYGASISAARVLYGNREFHNHLEQQLARCLQAEDSLLFPSGYGANVSTISYLFGEKDIIIHDEFLHTSCQQGIKFSGAGSRAFQHNNLSDLERVLKDCSIEMERTLVIVEGAYSINGDIVDLPLLLELKKKYKFKLMIDEAHSFGVLGKRGLGLSDYFEVNAESVDIWMGSLSKSLASMGGFIAGDSTLIETLRLNAPGSVFTAGLAAPLCFASLAAIEILENEPERVKRLQTISEFFAQKLSDLGIAFDKTCASSPIVSVVLKNEQQAVLAAYHLQVNGVLVKPFIYPAAPRGSGRLRFFITTALEEADLEFTAVTLAKYLENDSDS